MRASTPAAVRPWGFCSGEGPSQTDPTAVLSPDDSLTGLFSLQLLRSPRSQTSLAALKEQHFRRRFEDCQVSLCIGSRNVF